MNFKHPEKLVRAATILIVIYMLGFGAAMAFWPIRPFWNDEWRLVYNIKFKNVHELWGTLDLLQQCPRVYLTILKKIAAAFDYSYTSLRTPALVVTAASLPLCFYLRRKFFPDSPVYSYLFILILISSQTFTDYIVQVKQYEIEIFLCLLALWQLITLLELCEERTINKYKYCLLCASFAAAPYCSYMYPIAFAPVCGVILLASFVHLESAFIKGKRVTYLATLYLPLIIASISIIVFYIIDVRQLMADKSMYASYKKMLGDKATDTHFIADFWNLFALVGSGLLFEIIFGVIGIAAFCYAVYRLAVAPKLAYRKQDYLKLYGILLLILTLLLFLSGKLLGSVARLTSFTVPSIAMLIVYFLEYVKTVFNYRKIANVFTGILFLGLYGNIISTFINRVSNTEYSNRIQTYWNMCAVLKQVRAEKVPILITKGVLGDKIKEDAPTPGKVRYQTIDAEQIAGADTVCAEVVLKDNPEYKVWDTIPVYTIPDMKWLSVYMSQLPKQHNSAMAYDGINSMILIR